MMTVGIKAILFQEQTVSEQLTDHTVTHCNNVVAYLLLLLWSVSKFKFLGFGQKGVLSNEQADHCTSSLCLLHLAGHNIISSLFPY